MLNDRIGFGVAMTLGLSLLAGCGAGPATQARLTSAPSYRMASKAKIASLGKGLGWNNKGATPIVNDLPARKSLSLGFKIQDEAPKKVDLRPLMSPIADQGNFGSCTGFAMVKGIREFMELKAIRDRKGDATKEFVPLSPAYLWFNERSFTGESYIDTGAQMFLGMNLMMTGGVAPESAWPYPTEIQQNDPWYLKYFLPATPSIQAQRAAESFKGGHIRQITKLSEVKASLDEGYPVTYGFLVFDSIGRARHGGLLPVPNLQEDQLLGGHATVAVGYDDEQQVLILKNSWGTDFGDQGYLYMPYKFFDMQLGLVADGWTMRE